MVIGITYADKAMSISGELCQHSLIGNGVDVAYLQTPNDLSDEFKMFNIGTCRDGNRGAGCYWLFKPYIINRLMEETGNNNYIVYSDAGCEWIENPKHIIDVMDQDLFLFTSGHLQREWCKGDVLQQICPYSPPDQLQVQASVIFIRVSPYTRRFIKEWLLWCQMPGLIDDSPSVTPNHPDFKEHRHDQAILSALATRDNIKLHWWPDAIWFQNQRHRWPEDKYPPMLKHHRKRNNEWVLKT